MSSSGCPKLIIDLGAPKAGWLPVRISCGDFQREFAVSDVANDPVTEMIALLAPYYPEERREALFWLEPEAIILSVTASPGRFELELLQHDDAFSRKGRPALLFKFTGGWNRVIRPVRLALTRFAAMQYSDADWRYAVDRARLQAYSAQSMNNTL